MFRVQFDGGFETEAEARKIFDLIKKSKADKELKDISPQEKFSANIHICNHPNGGPCEIIEKVESEKIVEK